MMMVALVATIKMPRVIISCKSESVNRLVGKYVGKYKLHFKLTF